MVVVTGANIWTGEVYTNNPWGEAGSQTYEEFMSGFIGLPDTDDMPFKWCYSIF